MPRLLCSTCSVEYFDTQGKKYITKCPSCGSTYFQVIYSSTPKIEIDDKLIIAFDDLKTAEVDKDDLIASANWLRSKGYFYASSWVTNNGSLYLIGMKNGFNEKKS